MHAFLFNENPLHFRRRDATRRNLNRLDSTRRWDVCEKFLGFRLHISVVSFRMAMIVIQTRKNQLSPMIPRQFAKGWQRPLIQNYGSSTFGNWIGGQNSCLCKGCALEFIFNDELHAVCTLYLHKYILGRYIGRYLLTYILLLYIHTYFLLQLLFCRHAQEIELCSEAELPHWWYILTTVLLT